MNREKSETEIGFRNVHKNSCACGTIHFSCFLLPHLFRGRLHFERSY